MKFTMKNMPIGLQSRTPLEVKEANGTTLRVLRGRLWITQEGSVDDVFLDAGSRHTFRSDGKVLISAEGSPADTATIVFDSSLSVAGDATFTTLLKRLLAWRPAPLSTRSTGYEGI
jgi:hypothetical protein